MKRSWRSIEASGFSENCVSKHMLISFKSIFNNSSGSTTEFAIEDEDDQHNRWPE